MREFSLMGEWFHGHKGLWTQSPKAQVAVRTWAHISSIKARTVVQEGREALAS